MAISWTELAQKQYTEPEFLIDPYISAKGITFLWGKTSIGKSPLTWEMARAIGTGTSFFGLPTREARVLYLELDTPEVSIVKRLKRVPNPPPNVWWEFMPPLSIPYVQGEPLETLRRAQEDIRPDVVFINTLRKAHDMDDKESRAPKVVYSFFQHTFPQAALVFVHHMRKQAQDPNAITHDKEGFSGAMNWLNDAQAGLHLEPFSGEGENLRLYHRKSQVSDTVRPLPLFLEPDGTTLRCPLFHELSVAYEILNEADVSTAEMDVLIAQKLRTSLGTAKRRRLAIQGGKFPGSRAFLERLGGLGEDHE